MTPLPLLSSRAPRRIAVFRALHLGDLLCAVPALRALRRAAPDARITLIGLPWSQAFARRYAHYVDDWLEYPLGEALPAANDDAGEMQRFLAAAQARRFDLAIQLHGRGERSNTLVAALGAERTAGFHPPAQRAPGPHFLPWRDDEPEVRRWLRLVQHLGADARDAALELPVSQAERAEGALLLAQAGLAGKPYVCVHPGARLPSRRWPLHRFGDVAQQFADAGYSIAVTGSASELALTTELAADLRMPPGGAIADLAGRTLLGSLADIVARASLLICNDTGISHVAAAVGTPSVVISSGGDAQRWAPLRSDRHIVLAHDLPCRPCLHVECPIGHPCANAIGVDDVLAIGHALLARGARHVA